MKIPTNSTDIRLIFLRAENESGKSIDEATGSWGEHYFWRSINLDEAGSAMFATVAIVPNVHFDFIVKPRIVNQVIAPPKN